VSSVFLELAGVCIIPESGQMKSSTSSLQLGLRCGLLASDLSSSSTVSDLPAGQGGALLAFSAKLIDTVKRLQRSNALWGKAIASVLSKNIISGGACLQAYLTTSSKKQTMNPTTNKSSFGSECFGDIVRAYSSLVALSFGWERVRPGVTALLKTPTISHTLAHSAGIGGGGEGNRNSSSNNNNSNTSSGTFVRCFVKSVNFGSLTAEVITSSSSSSSTTTTSTTTTSTQQLNDERLASKSFSSDDDFGQKQSAQQSFTNERDSIVTTAPLHAIREPQDETQPTCAFLADPSALVESIADILSFPLPTLSRTMTNTSNTLSTAPMVMTIDVLTSQLRLAATTALLSFISNTGKFAAAEAKALCDDLKKHQQLLFRQKRQRESTTVASFLDPLPSASQNRNPFLDALILVKNGACLRHLTALALCPISSNFNRFPSSSTLFEAAREDLATLIEVSAASSASSSKHLSTDPTALLLTGQESRLSSQIADDPAESYKDVYAGSFSRVINVKQEVEQSQPYDPIIASMVYCGDINNNYSTEGDVSRKNALALADKASDLSQKAAYSAASIVPSLSNMLGRQVSSSHLQRFTSDPRMMISSGSPPASPQFVSSLPSSPQPPSMSLSSPIASISMSDAPPAPQNADLKLWETTADIAELLGGTCSRYWCYKALVDFRGDANRATEWLLDHPEPKGFFQGALK